MLRRKFIMAITKITVTKNQLPTAEQLAKIENASKKPVSFDEDCPELTPDQQTAFKALAKLRDVKRA